MIQSIEHEVTHDGWLEIDPRWVTNLFQIEFTGEVKCVLGKVHIGVRSPHIVKGAIVHGTGSMAFVPHGIALKPVSS